MGPTHSNLFSQIFQVPHCCLAPITSSASDSLHHLGSPAAAAIACTKSPTLHHLGPRPAVVAVACTESPTLSLVSPLTRSSCCWGLVTMFMPKNTESLKDLVLYPRSLPVLGGGIIRMRARSTRHHFANKCPADRETSSSPHPLSAPP